MVAVLHLGLEHPNLVWIALTGLLAFIAGLGVNLYRSSRTFGRSDPDENSE
ncbi:hypothetical protein [Halocatena salina]|uniref:Uncharacterized protein n=1 Tax=Halocatena salina TaxID=2934340 RepID=A0A8U0A5B6_9EURY|nr:hypothetical protein [Halocatena salina]UPM44391.1 hypothetical protein MW046_13155 [Halocatena salina]